MLRFGRLAFNGVVQALVIAVFLCSAAASGFVRMAAAHAVLNSSLEM